MIKIHRKSSLVDKDIIYNIFINEVQMGTIKDGETKSFNLRSNSYKIKIVNNEFQSKEINIDLDDAQLIQIVCYPLYKHNRLSKFIYKILYRKEAIYLKVNKDFHL